MSAHLWVDQPGTTGGGGLTQEQVDDRVAALLVAGTNVTLTYNDAAGTLTIDVSGGGLTQEQVEDIVAALINDNSDLDWTYDDALGTLVAVIKPLAVTNAMLAGAIALSKLATDPLARANHTGTQTASTVSDFDTQVAITAILKSLIDAKGDVLVGTADNTVARKAVGTNGQGLVADSAQTDGLKWVDLTRILRFVLDGGGSVVGSGAKKAYLTVPYDCTITKARLLADVSGSIVVDVWKDTYANFPPTVADTITASAKPTLSSAQKSEDSTLTGWTTTLSAGDIIEVNVDSVATVTKVYLDLFVKPR